MWHTMRHLHILTRCAMDIIFVPFLTRERFAALVGITPDVLERWIRDGRVRTFRMGKRSLVDLRQWVRESEVSKS